MSVTATAAQCILDALAAKIKNQSVFTAFDVTKDARDRTRETVPHAEVRNIVYQEFSTGQFPDNYNQDLVVLVINNKPIATVYFPDGKSALDHPLALQPPVATSTTIPIATSISNQVVAAPKAPKMGGRSKDGDGYICDVTADGRVNIPQDLCSKVKLSGGSYDVKFNGTFLYKKPHKDGRVRICKTELRDGSKYRVSVDTQANTIVIEQK